MQRRDFCSGLPCCGRLDSRARRSYGWERVKSYEGKNKGRPSERRALLFERLEQAKNFPSTRLANRAMAISTGQSWRELKSWYTAWGPNKDFGAVSQTSLALVIVFIFCLKHLFLLLLILLATMEDIGSPVAMVTL